MMKTKTRLKSFMIMVGLAICFIAAIGTVGKTKDDNYYLIFEYQILPGSKEWAEFTDHQQMLDACQIPQLWIDEAETIDVLASVLTYPLLSDYCAWGNAIHGMEFMIGNFDALKTFVQREDRFEAIEQIELEKISFVHEYDEPVAAYFLKSLKRYIEGSLEELPLMVSASTLVVNGNVITPNGTPVPHYEHLTYGDHNTTVSAVQALETNYQNTWPTSYAVKFQNANPKYNCHSYAWHNTSTSNYCWIDNPSYYWTDNSYQRYYGTIQNISRVVYYTTYPEHSAIVSSTSGSTVFVLSKWGCLGAYYHNLTYCPYWSNNVEARYYR